MEERFVSAGVIAAATPATRSPLTMLLPRIVPRPRAPWRRNPEISSVAISGVDVPKATSIAPTENSEIPSEREIRVDPSTINHPERASRTTPATPKDAAWSGGGVFPLLNFLFLPAWKTLHPAQSTKAPASQSPSIRESTPSKEKANSKTGTSKATG